MSCGDDKSVDEDEQLPAAEAADSGSAASADEDVKQSEESCDEAGGFSSDLFVFISVYFVRFCFILHSCCSIVSAVGWT